jgi:hypothetical protein
MVGDIRQRLVHSRADRALSVGEDPHDGHWQGRLDLVQQGDQVVLGGRYQVAGEQNCG